MSIDLEQAKTSDDPGSMAAMREKHRQNRVVLQGHPNDPALEEGPPEDKEELPEGKHVQPPAEEKVEAPPPKEEPPSAPPLEHEGKKFKYASQEEAERASEEAARKMHEATSELSELKKRLEEIEKGQAQPKEEAPPRPELSEDLEEQIASTWREIDGLDPYEEDYEKTRAKLFGKLLTLQQGQPRVDDSFIDRKVEEKLEQRRQVEKQKEDQEAEVAASRNAAIQMARESGLNMDDRNISRLFWNALADAPYHEGVTLKEQVDFMVGEVKGFYKNLAAERGESAPQQEILGRGGRTPIRETKEADKPKTLSEMKDDWREKRRI